MVGVEFLNRVLQYKDLEIDFSYDLSFKLHVALVVDDVYSTLGFIMRSCRNFKQIDTLKMFYFATVRPKLEYSSVI
jgi:hypothetical protein